jgi:hypothetical protein
VKTVDKAMLLKQPIGLLVVTNEQSNDDRTSPPQVGKKVAPEQMEISGRYCAATHLLGERRYGFNDSQAGHEQSGPRGVPEEVYFRRTNFGVVVFYKSTGVKKMVGH